jgi:hypothetical protein
MRLALPAQRGKRMIAVLALAGAMGLVLLVATFLGSPDEGALLVGEVRDEIIAVRGAVDTCTAAMASEEARFREHDRRVESLRESVRSFKSPDGERVPADRYSGYLAAFDRYNEAVREWHERAESLRTQSTDCRALAQRHNVLVDSLQQLVGAARDGSAE